MKGFWGAVQQLASFVEPSFSKLLSSGVPGILGKDWHIIIFPRDIPFWSKTQLCFRVPNSDLENKIFGLTKFPLKGISRKIKGGGVCVQISILYTWNTITVKTQLAQETVTVPVDLDRKCYTS